MNLASAFGLDSTYYSWDSMKVDSFVRCSTLFPVTLAGIESLPAGDVSFQIICAGSRKAICTLSFCLVAFKGCFPKKRRRLFRAVMSG